jgi:uncharacterized membrane protein HdeD (DUF308 family)
VLDVASGEGGSAPRGGSSPHANSIRKYERNRVRAPSASVLQNQSAGTRLATTTPQEVHMPGSTTLIVRGLVAIAVAFVSFLWPTITIAAMVLLFGVYAVVDGVINISLGFTHTGVHNRWAYVLLGIVGIVAGVLTFFWPVITAFVLIMVIGAWAVVHGIFEIAAAIGLRRVIRGEWLLALSGVVSILFGLVVFFFPLAGAIGIALVFGWYALIAGILLLALGIRMRRGRLVA